MILNCPQCSARFLVADSLIPAGGRTVRCGACTHQWHVNHPAGTVAEDFKQLLSEAVESTPTPTEQEQTPQTPTPNVPAIAERKWPVRPFKIAALAFAVLWAVLALLTYFPRGMHMPVIGSVYSLFGVQPTTGLAFADIAMERVDGETKTQFIVSGNITNHTAQTRTVPIVHVSLNDADGETLWSREYPVQIELKAGEKYPFRIVNIETSFAENVKTITLDLGNALELFSR